LSTLPRPEAHAPGGGPLCGPVAGAGAAQTRQIAHPDARDRGISHLKTR
jgi:hypothetical protein